jgi:multiple antibiotic resistance protein
MPPVRGSGTKATPAEEQECAAKSGASIIPLGMPMLAGPGAIAALMVLVGESHSVWRHVLVYTTIVPTGYARRSPLRC